MSTTTAPAAPLARTDGSEPAARPATLRIEGLSVAFGRTPVLGGVDLEAHSGEILGLIGETGSGKTTLARAVAGLAPVTAGRITVDGTDHGALRGRALRAARRAGTVQYMFQDPLRSLDPDLTVARLVGEPLAVAGVPRAEREERVREALDRVGLDPALTTRTPARLSGGQRQRVALARAVVGRPRLLLADEPVSALDASNRNHVLRLLDRLRRELDLAVVVISHDLDSLAGIADRIAVLYRGRIVEQGPARTVLEHPLHPYSALLGAAAPSLDPARRADLELLRTPAPGAPSIGGQDGSDPGGADRSACAFAHRCPFADRACAVRPDPLPATTPAGANACAASPSPGTPAPLPVALPVGAPAGATVAEHTVACHHSPGWRARLPR
ncbi:ABC transporter ATP-binding protein [Streptomyces sp. BE303]|uniref:ABC transporter ATP-binding protein n=1 Tax=Streptomyces sp. BE303 TaxID=3002528 RepID=UPI002E775220|nr:ATP-binding cassette domain-containing protein [Streptomyces sp. BE303]MED7947517.1 ATP-binding cassette domain-containing protein [Streptomyces sp. BE303]